VSGPRAEEIGESACELETTDDQPRPGKTTRCPNSLVGGSANPPRSAKVRFEHEINSSNLKVSVHPFGRQSGNTGALGR
jgi:hypothetical protein